MKIKSNKPTRLTSLSLIIVSAFAGLSLMACSPAPSNSETSTASNPKVTQKDVAMIDTQQSRAMHHSLGQGKPVIYQMFTRLFGNTNQTNTPWGTLEENGVGKFNDITDEALLGIKELGTSYVWYTGVPHHAVIRDYTEFGISNDDPDVVKGRAGSPYAVKDYYNVNPDLAVNVENRLEEFEALIARTHKHDMKVIIDIVPNHVARDYQSLSAPEGEEDFGASDDTSVEYARDNNFYYIVGESFKVPEDENYQPLGGEEHPLSDGKFEETPAKWTGNGSRAAQPSINDWYETVKVNYGVRPDGTYDFERLPETLRGKSFKEHAKFWQNKQLPDSWYKFESIVHYWLDKGVDGFRFDMAEMVPVEFWSFLNSSIKRKHPDALLLAEVYNPTLYRDYIEMGLMDYLYDKVGFYDDLKAVMQGRGDAQSLEDNQNELADIQEHMLHFLENHDEQRIASPDFAGTAIAGKPALVASALISESPTMLYFGQDVGEDGSEETGFGDPTRTTIFDYAGVPAHQRWMNGGAFDGGLLTDEEKALREFHIKVMNISAKHPAMFGKYASLHSLNRSVGGGYQPHHFSFVRYTDKAALVVVVNLSATPAEFDLQIPIDIVTKWTKQGGELSTLDLLSDKAGVLTVAPTLLDASMSVKLDAWGSSVFEIAYPELSAKE